MASALDLETLQLAALLHDLGKFWQRTGEPRPPLARELEDLAVGRHGAHARWSAAFIQGHVPQPWHTAAWPALTHHLPAAGDRLARLVAAADRLAAAERRELEEEGEVRGPQQLRSILAGVAGPETGWRFPATSWYYPLCPLGSYTRETLFPSQTPLQEEPCRQAYRRLWEGFLREHQHLPREPFAAYFTSLYFLLQKYTWCIPSAYYRAEPDVSLFDHARITCALATCLWLDQTPEDELEALLHPAEEGEAIRRERFLLVGGDVSGVQRFLYTISSQGALRGLRGRSFYLQLLAQAIVRRLLRAWGLSLPHLIYEGGGHFYLLAPLRARETLPALRRELSQALVETHRGALFVALDAVPLSATHLLKPAELTEGFRRLAEQLNAAKRRKGSELPLAYLEERLFTPQPGGGPEHRACRVCRGEIDDAPTEPPADPDDPQRKCPLCRGLEELGDRLRRGSSLLLWEIEAPPPAAHPAGASGTGSGHGQELALAPAIPGGGWQRALRWLGLEAMVLRPGQPLRPDQRPVVPPGAQATLLRLQDADFEAAHKEAATLGLPHAAIGFHLLAQATPLSTEQPDAVADFEELASSSTGIKRLGYLRADMDNLGQIILRGLCQADAAGQPIAQSDRASLSRRAALSFSLRLFFEGWLSTLCDAYNPRARSTPSGAPAGSDRLYLIYGGGDDLFLAGAWDAVAKAAAEIAQTLREFAGHNPAVHLSAGIALRPPKYPLYRVAEEAGETLEAAKRLDGKDAISLLSWPLPRESYAHARDLAEELAGAVRGLQVEAPRALLQLAVRLCRQAAEEHAQRGLPRTQVAWGRWMWQGAYQLARLRERRPELAPLAERVRASLVDAGQFWELMVAAAWADLLVRADEAEG